MWIEYCIMVALIFLVVNIRFKPQVKNHVSEKRRAHADTVPPTTSSEAKVGQSNPALFAKSTIARGVKHTNSTTIDSIPYNLNSLFLQYSPIPTRHVPNSHNLKQNRTHLITTLTIFKTKQQSLNFLGLFLSLSLSSMISPIFLLYQK